MSQTSGSTSFSVSSGSITISFAVQCTATRSPVTDPSVTINTLIQGYPNGTTTQKWSVSTTYSNTTITSSIGTLNSSGSSWSQTYKQSRVYMYPSSWTDGNTRRIYIHIYKNDVEVPETVSNQIYIVMDMPSYSEPTYTNSITLHTNGGILVMDGGTYSDHHTHTESSYDRTSYLAPSSYSISKTGYDFIGWSFTESGSPSYGPTESVPYQDGLDIYAQWSAHTYTMRYDPNGGSGSIPSGTKTYGIDYIVKTASGFNPPAAGYVFDHWHYISSDGHEGNLNPYDAYTRNYSATFYAIWTLETYKVSYDPNGGSTTPSSEWHAAGDYVTLAAGIAKANSPEQQDGHYTVTYNGNGGVIVRNYDYAYIYLHYEYLFRAWAYGSNEYPERYYPFHMPPNNVEFVAQFNQYSHYRTESVTLPSGTKSGYTLDHWETSAGVNVGAPGATYTPPNQSLILYAIWEPVYHFDWDAPKVSGQPFNVTANEWVRYGNTMRQRFIDEGRTPPTFRSITAGVTVFSKEYWNDFVDAVNTIHPGSMTHVSSGDIVYASGFSTLKNKLNT